MEEFLFVKAFGKAVPPKERRALALRLFQAGTRKPGGEPAATPRPRGRPPLRWPFRGRGAGRDRAEVPANARPGGAPEEREPLLGREMRNRDGSPPG
ncbi:unnamed protein product, partial [Bubo scandiacus]